jgi:ribosomal protein L11 methyltransferase
VCHEIVYEAASSEGARERICTPIEPRCMTIRYPYVHVSVTRDDVELVSLELWEHGAAGVEERDASTMNAPDADAAAGVTLVASFADEAQAQAAIDALAPRYAARLEFVEGDAWREAYKAYFKPTKIGTRLWIKPSWEELAPSPGDVVLELDPGAAFGTGTHETTRLVLEELQSHVRAGGAVLDVGCGSGILSIAALLLGAGRAVAIDVDPEAVRVARENAEHNAVAARMRVSDANVGAIHEAFPLVLANIETRVLVPLASEICARVAPGGTLILSGILAPERDTVMSAYTQLQAAGARQMGDWVALVLRRTPEPRRDG